MEARQRRLELGGLGGRSPPNGGRRRRRRKNFWPCPVQVFQRTQGINIPFGNPLTPIREITKPRQDSFFHGVIFFGNAFDPRICKNIRLNKENNNHRGAPRPCGARPKAAPMVVVFFV